MSKERGYHSQEDSERRKNRNREEKYRDDRYKEDRYKREKQSPKRREEQVYDKNVVEEALRIIQNTANPGQYVERNQTFNPPPIAVNTNNINGNTNTNTNNNSESSELEDAITKAETEFNLISPTLEKIRAMKENLEKLKTNRKFTKEEVAEYEESFMFHRGVLISKLDIIVSAINDAKKLWTDKQTFMASMHSQGLLDHKVARFWDKSLASFQDKIEKLDTKLLFLKVE